MKISTNISQSASRAFTLVELVISSALMSIIIAGGYLCLNAALESRKLVDTRSDSVQSARVAMTLIASDLRSACPLSRDYEFLGMDRMVEDVEADNLDFATHFYKPQKPYEGDFCEVSWFLAKEEKSGEYVLYRRRDPTRDPEPLQGGNREEIARGVRGLRFEYYDGFEWFDEWGDPQGKRQGEQAQQSSLLAPTNLSGLPEAVRITLLFAAEGGTRTGTNSVALGAPGLPVNGEAPLTLQTVVRLNLAAASWQGGSGVGASGQGNNATQQEGTVQ